MSRLGVDLKELVEVGENDSVVGDWWRRTLRLVRRVEERVACLGIVMVRVHVSVGVDLVRIGQIGNRLGVVANILRRRGH